MVRSDLEDVGSMINESKYVSVPAQQIQWLGFMFDFSESKVDIPREKLNKVKDKASQILN
jgi:hypothetical protein